MYIRNMMKYIAANMSEISHELGGGNVSGEDVLEVYKLEMDFLAQEVGLVGHLPLLGEYLQLIEDILGEEQANSLAQNELINLLKVICAIKLGE
jgi:hypothetical protein